MSETAPAATATAPVTAPEADGVKTFSLEYVQQLRQESAGYRTRLESAVEEAKTSTRAESDTEWTSRVEEAQAALQQSTADLAARDLELMRIGVAIDSEIPSEGIREFAKLLNGSTEDELKSHAGEVKKLFALGNQKSPAYDYTQSKDNDVLPLNGDPLLESVMKVINKN